MNFIDSHSPIFLCRIKISAMLSFRWRFSKLSNLSFPTRTLYAVDIMIRNFVYIYDYLYARKAT